ncbi:MAG: zinc ribbon domain-containing protein [Lachnospiraceae bacterium]|nr:zinc ribbon domain-containing protein [Lachnospiraceae bacterium]
MKCKHCGAEVDFEDKFCKSCGMPNSFATKHIADMEHYARDYNETKEEVDKRTKGALKVAIRIAAIFVLIILIGVASNMDEIRYDLHKRKTIKEVEAHKDAYDQKLKEYIANEEFIEMYHYVSNGDILVYGASLYDNYGLFFQSVSDYSRVFTYTEELYHYMYMDKNNTVSSFDYGKYVEDEKKTVAKYVATFYEEKKNYLERLDSTYCDIPKEYQELEVEALNVMSEHITDLAMGVFGITEEDAYSLDTMSSAKIEVLFEEAKVNE